MKTKVKSYAAMEPGGSLEPFEYELGNLGPDEIDIQVEYCGICHTDLSMLDNEWGLTDYPFIGGHEVVGKVVATGDQVTHVETGDQVGLGANAGYCMTCSNCLSGHHNMCPSVSNTVIGRHGGFADVVRASGVSVIKLPVEMDARLVGPLLCAGITVFNPLVQFDIKPTSRVAVLGIGGLGHLALQFARAWGCHVTAFTSHSKMQQALEMGAHETIDSRDPDAIARASGQFDLILSTVDVKLDWNGFLATLSERGRLHFLGVQTEPVELSLMPMLFRQLSVSSSPVGSPQTIADMLSFCARHQIVPVTEHFRFEQINDAIQHLRDGKARYRIVLDHK